MRRGSSFFGQNPKNEPHSPPSRERSEREMQKTLLGYAHPSITKIYKKHFDSRNSYKINRQLVHSTPNRYTSNSTVPYCWEISS
ncbi:MAG: hypothetical protein U5L45_08275 [Saprospiraceae bacterium]|nr:hypothetical protein [Saprospiraceae bacterium]